MAKQDGPVVRYSRITISEAMDLAEAELLRVQAPIYQMKGGLVQIIRVDSASDEGGIRRKAGALLIQQLSPHRLLEIFLQSVTFAVFDARKNRYVRGAPPLEFAKHYAARGMWNLRVLRGITEAPTLRPDGTVLAEPGYDEATGLYLDTNGVEFPPVPERPARDEALAALAALKDIIKDFPFVPDDEEAPLGDRSASRSVALAAILTAGCRRALRTAPAFGFDATSMETGKSLLCDTVSLIWMGRDAAAISQGETREEFDKRLFAILLQGDPLVVIDNIEEPVRSAEFNKVLTSEETQGRVLGISGNRTVSTSVTFLLNGNGLVFEGDIRTRVLLCNMDARMEKPGERKFDRDLRAYIPANRPRLVAAALTVLRAFIVAGRPGLHDLASFGRFEEWSNLVRAALVWLDEPDPCDTREAIAAVDPERDKLAAVMRAWQDAIGPDRWVTAKEVIDEAYAGDMLTRSEEAEALFAALDEACPRLSAKTLGRYLTKFAGRIVNGMTIRKHATVGHSTKFALRICQENEAAEPSGLAAARQFDQELGLG